MKKLVALLLAMSLVLAMLAGCSSGEAISSTNGENSDVSTGEVAENPEDYFKNPITIKVMGMGPSNIGESGDGWSNNEFFKRLQEKTNVTIEWICPVSGNEQTEFDLMLSSGEYVDMTWALEGATYTDGYDAGVDDGVYRDLKDYIPKYMPNLWEYIENDEIVRKYVYTDKGRIVELPRISYNIHEKKAADGMVFAGIGIRGQWLDELNLEMPTTYSELHDVLVQFKENYNCEQPFYFPGQGYFALPAFYSGFGAISGMQANGDKVEFGPITEGWKAYVTEMHKWYDEGLIGSEYLTNNSIGYDTNAMINGVSGVGVGSFADPDILEEAVPGYDMRALPLLTVNKGDVAQGQLKPGYAGAKFTITTAMKEEYLPQVMAMLDYLYSYEGALDAALGVEGDTYIVKEDGTFEYTDKIMNNPQYETPAAAKNDFLCPANLQALGDWYAQYMTNTDEQWEILNTWAEGGSDLNLPAFKLNPEESAAYAAVITDCNSCMQEWTNNFIMGIASLDQWDEYVDQMKQLGIDQAVEAYQSAYDRYMEKE